MISAHTPIHHPKQPSQLTISSIREQLNKKFPSRVSKTPKNKSDTSIGEILSSKINKPKAKKQSLSKTQQIHFLQENHIPERQPLNPIKNQNNSQVKEEESVIVHVKELEKFTKMFAQQKIDYEQQVAALKFQVEQKSKKIQEIEQKMWEAIDDQHRMMQEMQRLKLKHEKQIQQYTNQLCAQDQSMRKLQKEIMKLNGWVKEERDENRRLIEIIKTKKQSQQYSTVQKNVSLSLQWSNQFHIGNKIKEENKEEFKIYMNDKTKDIHEQLKGRCESKSPRKNKKIVIKKHKLDTPKCSQVGQSNFSTLSTEFQQKMKQMMSLLRDRQLQIQRLKKQNEELLHRSDQLFFQSESFNLKNIHNERQIILVNKCISLETQIEKLMQKLVSAGHRQNIPTPEIVVKLDNQRGEDVIREVREESEEIADEQDLFFYM